MSNAAIFIYPGEAGATFLLSLFDAQPSNIHSDLFWLMSVVISIFVWLYLIRTVVSAATAMIKKIFGFGGQYR